MILNIGQTVTSARNGKTYEIASNVDHVDASGVARRQAYLVKAGRRTNYLSNLAVTDIRTEISRARTLADNLRTRLGHLDDALEAGRFGDAADIAEMIRLDAILLGRAVRS